MRHCVSARASNDSISKSKVKRPCVETATNRPVSLALAMCDAVIVGLLEKFNKEFCLLSSRNYNY
jgi:hypothetical protein